MPISRADTVFLAQSTGGVVVGGATLAAAELVSPGIIGATARATPHGLLFTAAVIQTSAIDHYAGRPVRQFALDALDHIPITRSKSLKDIVVHNARLLPDIPTMGDVLFSEEE